MAIVGYHCSHEQYAPSQLLRYVKRAGECGFAAAMCSDHIHPWSERHSESGFAWSWLGAAMQATRLPFGVVNAPGQRYHPAIIAQAAATLSELFPQRLWLALGSGQALNEHITGTPFPPKPERNRRLRECAEVLRALWAGETVNHQGLVQVSDAKLYSRPAVPPMIVGACLSPETAAEVGDWADALITVATLDRQKMIEVVDAFRRGGGEGKPLLLQVAFSYAPTHEEALQAAYHEWRHVALGMEAQSVYASPRAFDEATAMVTPDDMQQHFRISASLSQHVEWLAQDIELGFSHLYLHNVHRDQERFIDVFAEKVLPVLPT